MKFFIVFAAVVVAVSAQHPEQPPIAILKLSHDFSPEGSYSFAYETENGISASESGTLGQPNAEGEVPVVSQGQYEYKSPDGNPISVSYTADENGFQPRGSHIHPAILRALEWNLAHPEQNEQHQKKQY